MNVLDFNRTSRSEVDKFARTRFTRDELALSASQVKIKQNSLRLGVFEIGAKLHLRDRSSELTAVLLSLSGLRFPISGISHVATCAVADMDEPFRPSELIV